MKKLFLLGFVAFTCSLAHAQGTCPSGLPVSGAHCYFVAANGIDTNNGTSESTPWLHAPGMPNCSNTCAGVTPSGAEGIIFRGGDTWHFGNSSASPYTGVVTATYQIGWQFSYSGSSSSCDYRPSVPTTASCLYVGVDKAWFSGGSWARPIMNLDNPTWSSSSHQDGSHSGFVTACSYEQHNYIGVVISGNYVTFDNLEWQGWCWNAVTTFGNGVVKRNGTFNNITNSYFHNWTETYNPQTPGNSPMDQFVIIPGGSGLSHNVTAYSVFDGSDAGLGTSCVANTSCTGGPVAYSDAEYFYNNIVRWIANGLNSPSNVISVHDNLFELVNESYEAADHGAVIEVGSSTILPNATPMYFYNNVFRNTDMGETVETLNAQNGGPLYMFNNVFWGIGNPGNCLYVEQQSGSGDTATTYYFYNNTVDSNSSGCSMRISGGTGGTQNPFYGTVYFENTGSTATVTDNGHHIFQSEATANGQGYTTSNNYAPTCGTSSCSTIGAAANLETSCSTFSTDNAFCSGTSNGCSETSYGGGEGVNCPAITVNPRKSTAGSCTTGTPGCWDSGAYLYSSGSPSFTCSPSTIPQHHTGNIPITCTWQRNLMERQHQFQRQRHLHLRQHLEHEQHNPDGSSDHGRQHWHLHHRGYNGLADEHGHGRRGIALHLAHEREHGHNAERIFHGNEFCLATRCRLRRELHHKQSVLRLGEWVQRGKSRHGFGLEQHGSKRNIDHRERGLHNHRHRQQHDCDGHIYC
jgi:hypothetical protein